MHNPFRACAMLVAALAFLSSASEGRAQIDPEKRRLIQLGYNQPIQGKAPIAGYGFFYYNQPGFIKTNLTLRAAIAPVYLDAELGISQAFGPNTDIAFGLAGGGFADTYSEIRGGKYLEDESFVGHGAEISASLFHRFNPDQVMPLWFVLKATARESLYQLDTDTSPAFTAPDDVTSFNIRSGFRLGGQEPSLTEPLAAELSLWHEGRFRTDSQVYGYSGDREVESDSQLFWARALLKYTFDQTEQLVQASITAGTSINADRFSAYRMGGILPFVSEFPLNIPGYFFQEISAESFALLNAQYSFPVHPAKNFRISMFGATGPVDYLDGLEQSGEWHSGAGGGITYISPSGSWLVSLVYGHGFDAIRSSGRGADNVGLLFQYDFEAKRRGKSRFFIPGMSPYRSRGGERIFR